MRSYLYILLFLSNLNHSLCQIRLPKLISNGLVLQRDVPLKIWGWASAGEKISLTFKSKSYKTKANEAGEWQINIPAQPAGTGFTMLIKGKNQVAIDNIAIGEVWFCSGQSNMVINTERVKEKYGDDIAQANFPDIRNFFVPTLTDLNEPKTDIPNGEWKAAQGKDVLTMGALTFFFARELHQKYKVPVGIINSSVGGTPVEAWISETGFKNFPDQLQTILKNKDTSYVNAFNRRGPMPNSKPAVRDKGLLEHWEGIDYQPKGWRSINIPGFWEDQGLKDLNGVVYYRKEIDLPASWINKPVKLYMGRIVDADEMYVNGKKIGNITYQYPPRRYEIPAGLLKVGKNLFVVKVTNTAGKGGFVPDKPYFMTNGSEEIDLKGTWQYKIGEVYEPSSNGFGGPSFSRQNQPAALYNAMVAPFVNYPVRGFVWYQGESNAGNPGQYDKHLKALIEDWRQQWKATEAPFLFVQLANFMDYTQLPTESSWAELRNKQRKVLAVPHTAMAVITDCGEWNDIHPLNKKDIGLRLAKAAQNIAYAEPIVYSGPLFRAVERLGDKMRLSFDHVGSGLVTKDGEPLRYFAIAGADKKYVWAEAVIEGDNIVLWSEKIKEPKFVRYNWADNPEGNLYNKEGFPASAFETE